MYSTLYGLYNLKIHYLYKCTPVNIATSYFGFFSVATLRNVISSFFPVISTLLKQRHFLGVKQFRICDKKETGRLTTCK